MKKVLIGISALALLAFVLILTVSAQDQKDDKVKAETEAVTPADCGSCTTTCGSEMETPPAAPPAECGMAAGCDKESCAECTCEECTGNCDECADECKENCEEKCAEEASSECAGCTAHK
jgi:hypothetical protein